MGDVDVLDMLFDGDSGILGFDDYCGGEKKQQLLLPPSSSSSSQQQHSTTTTSSSSLLLSPSAATNEKMMGMEHHLYDQQSGFKQMNSGFDIMDHDDDWPSALLPTTTSSLDNIDHNDFLSALIETNLPDDVKQQQQQLHHPQQKHVSDHAYSITPASPHSDSGVSSTGPYSPSSSGNEIEDLAFDIDRDLFGPLDLKNYNDLDGDLVTGVDPMLLDSLSEGSSSPPLAGNESPVRFDFEELSRNSSQPTVQGLTISTDETTKVIKVLSVNGSSRNQTVHQLSSKQQPVTTDSPYPELMLSDEEKDLLRKEGISLPSHLPLTREEEKILRSVRRRIRNKASARNSRRKKQDYMEALEKRVKLCTDEKRQLEKKVVDLEKRNSSLIGQLKKLQKLVSDSTRQTAKTGTCALILALSFALVLLPNYRSLVGGGDSSHDTLMQVPSDIGGRPARSLLSKSEDYMSTSQSADKSFNFIPFLNYNNGPSLVSPARQPVDEPIDEEVTYTHDPVENIDNMKHRVVSTFSDVDEKVIHLEITKLPDGGSTSITEVENHTTKKDHIVPDGTVRQRHIRMDLSDEL